MDTQTLEIDMLRLSNQESVIVDYQSKRLEDAILQTAAYADIFDHPLSAEECHRYLLGTSATREEVSLTLNSLRKDGVLAGSSKQQWYPLSGKEKLILTRLERERRANALWPLAKRYGQMIGRLPYVRMVAVTGSLAVNNPDLQADIDYFIVTEPDRLWLTRLLVIGIVRLAAQSGVQLCPNFFITKNNLEIKNRNLYTAREISQMVPLVGLDVYNQFRQINRWTLDFLPNAADPPTSTVRPCAWSTLRSERQAPMLSPSGATGPVSRMREQVRRSASSASKEERSTTLASLDHQQAVEIIAPHDPRTTLLRSGQHAKADVSIRRHVMDIELLSDLVEVQQLRGVVRWRHLAAKIDRLLLGVRS